MTTTPAAFGAATNFQPRQGALAGQAMRFAALPGAPVGQPIAVHSESRTGLPRRERYA